MKRIIILPILFVVMSVRSALGQQVDHWETAVFNTDSWRYFLGYSDPDPSWISLFFNDSGWSEGPGGFGFGDDDDNTIIPYCRSVFIRTAFVIQDTSLIDCAILHIDFDDGFVAYINGTEIARSGVQGINPSCWELAADHEAMMFSGEKPESYFLSGPALRELLVHGPNILAVQVHNSSDTSSDMSSNVWLSFGIKDASVFFRHVPDWFTPLSEFKSSNLPIVFIRSLPGEDLIDGTKITADLKIIYNGPGQQNRVSDDGNIYSGKIGIEIRGNYSSSLPQKPYGLETRDEAGNNLNVSILDMPEENDWILTANYNDKSFLRNFLAFHIFSRMGHYAPRSSFCELVLNDQYMGIYLFGEKIKVDKNRVDIAKLNPDENSGDDLTGGYIFSNDYYTDSDSWESQYSPLNRPGSDVFFVYYDPKPGELTGTQKLYLKQFVDSFERSLYSSQFRDIGNGYRAFIDAGSFIDYFILGEITRNVDAYKKSRFLYKDKDSRDGKIHSGPPWDFDWAWKDITEDCIHFNQTDGSGWAYLVNDCNNWPVPPSWEIRLLQDELFANQIYKRYFSLRGTILSESYLHHVIDSVAILLDEAQERHFMKWNILGRNVGTSEFGEQPYTYEGEIEKFKSWINRRLKWLDANMVGEATNIPLNEPVFRIFPNPVSDFLNIESDIIIDRIEIISFMGVVVQEDRTINNNSFVIDVSRLSPGLYTIRIHDKTDQIINRRFIRK